MITEEEKAALLATEPVTEWENIQDGSDNQRPLVEVWENEKVKITHIHDYINKQLPHREWMASNGFDETIEEKENGELV